MKRIRFQPNVPAAYNFRARLYARQGRYAAAVLDHSRACELDGANAGHRVVNDVALAEPAVDCS